MSLLAIGVSGDMDRSRLDVFAKSVESARASGADYIAVFCTGDDTAVRARARGIPVVSLPQAGLQQGEAAIVWAAVEYARRIGQAWIVKAAGDTFHPSPGWAARLVELAKAQGAGLVATHHHQPERVNTQVFAGTIQMLRRTVPRPWDPRLSRIGLEPAWGASIIARGLQGQWHAPAGKEIRDAHCVNFAPAEPGITYFHAHSAGSAADWRLAGQLAPVLPDPSLSIVIPCRNEVTVGLDGKPLLSETIYSIAATSAGHAPPEVIIVDDGSDQELPIVRPDGLPLRVLRNPSPLGVDPARNIGAAAATGDVIGILDGHMKVETQEGEAIPGGLQRLARLAVELDAIVVGRCAHLELKGQRKNDDYPLCGANFVRITNDKHLVGVGWNHVNPPRGIVRVPAMLGASYFFPRHIWELLGGFVDACKCWGFSEEGMSLKAAFMDVPIYCDCDVTVSHWFRSTGPHPFVVDGFQKWINAGKILKATFEPDTFENFWLPRVKMIPGFLGNWGVRHESELAEDILWHEGQRFRARKRRTDEYVLKEFFGVEAGQPVGAAV